MGLLAGTDYGEISDDDDNDNKHDTADTESVSSSEGTGTGENTDTEEDEESELTSCDDPDESGDEVTSSDSETPDDEEKEEVELVVAPRLIYAKGIKYDSSYRARLAMAVAERLPFVACRRVFQLNERDAALLPEDQRNQLLGEKHFTLFGVRIYTLRAAGDSVLIDRVYDSVRVGNVYTEVARRCLAEPELVTRTAVTADGKPTTGFRPKLLSILTNSPDYDLMLRDIDTFCNTVDHVINQYVIRGLRGQMAQPNPSDLSFRSTGPRGGPLPHGRLSESGSSTVTLKKNLFMMKAFVSCTAISILLVDIWRFRRNARYPAARYLHPTMVHIEPSSGPQYPTMGEYMVTRMQTCRSLFDALQRREAPTWRATANFSSPRNVTWEDINNSSA
jgi:hypothetical protein